MELFSVHLIKQINASVQIRVAVNFSFKKKKDLSGTQSNEAERKLIRRPLL